MIKISSITALGLLVLLIASPFIDLPRDWKNSLLMLCGVAIIVLSIMLRKELHKVIRIVHGVEEVKPDTYVESHPK